MCIYIYIYIFIFFLVWPILKQNRPGVLKEGLVDSSLLLETGMAVATDVVSLV